MRILFVEFTSAISGAERSLLELIQGLRDEHELALACPTGPLADRAAELGVPVLPIPASQLTFRLHPRHTTRGLADMARAARRLRSIVRGLLPDVVHANSIRAGLLAIPAARGLGSVVVHCRDALPQGWPGAAVRAVVLSGSDGVVAISRYVAESLAGPDWAARHVTVVDNAVDAARFDPSSVSRDDCRASLAPDGGLVLSVIAQITPWKGQDLAIQTLAELRRRGRDAQLLIVGEAKFVGAATRHDNRAFERELHALVATNDLAAHVRFLGERSDPECILAATDVLLVPSIDEPFGRTIIEAMAMGVPVAATSVGGPREILVDEVAGHIVSSRRTAQWADAVEDLASWPPERRGAGRVVVETRFSRRRHATGMIAVYEAAVAHGMDLRRRGRARAQSSIALGYGAGMPLRHRVAEAIRPKLQLAGEQLYRVADGTSRAAFRNETRALSAPITINGVTIDTVDDIAEFTGLGRAVAEAEVATRRSLNFRSEWFATPAQIRRDHWFYLSSKTYLFANASHFTDGAFVPAFRDRVRVGARVLDFGGGSGELSLQLAAAGYHVTFLELNCLQRDFMRFRIDRHALHGMVEVLDPWASVPRAAFDAVIAMDVIEHLPNAAEILREKLIPARKDDGLLVENSPFVVNPGNPMHHEDFGFDALMAEHGLVEAKPILDARVWAGAESSVNGAHAHEAA